MIDHTKIMDYKQTQQAELSSVFPTPEANSEQQAELQLHIKLNNLRNHTLKLIANSRPLKEILYNIAKGVEIENPDMLCSILLLETSTQQLTVGAAPSLPRFYNDAVEGTPVAYGIGACGTAASIGKRTITEDINTHAFWQDYKELTQKAGVASCWSEPIFSSAGCVVGTFAIYKRQPSTPTATDFHLIEQSAHLASIAIELASANDKIWRQTNYDRLTGLANRQQIYNQLQIMLAEKHSANKQLALLHIDLDNFKSINSSFGYDCGDRLLMETANRISLLLAKGDSVARISADEFVVVVNDANLRRVDELSERILLQLSKPFQTNATQSHLTASIGIAVYPSDAQDTDGLIKCAEQAMQNSKAQAAGCSQYFCKEVQQQTLKRQSLINDMRAAVDRNEFHLLYQPIVDMNTNKIVKVEALLRWQHPQLGNIPPLDFIPLAEETGIITAIGNWVFKTAMMQITQWRERLDPQLRVAINTSPAQYKQESFELLFEHMAENNIDPNGLVIEITEGMLIESTSEVANKISRLREAGIHVAIDDFGTGYASLSYLTKFKVDYLKIDKSFVWNMHNEGDQRIICETVLMMAKRMGLKVVAEGIETQEQFDLLRSMECEFGQGYHMAKPLSADDFEQLYLANLITNQ